MLAWVRSAGSLSRAEISRRAKLSLPTVAAIVRDLERDGLVRVVEPESHPGVVGRPSPRVELNPDGAFVLAADIGATVTRLALCDLLGYPMHHGTIPTPGTDPASTITGLVVGLKTFMQAKPKARVQGLAVGVPGYVSADCRTVLFASNLPGWRDIPLADALEDALGISCVLDNDVNMAAIGEGYFGMAKGVRDYVFLDLGTGIGTGIVIDGRLHRGSHGLGGEFALVAHAGAGGRIRSIEAEAAGWALRDQAQRLGFRDVPGLFTAFETGDSRAQTVLKRAIRALAVAVANLCAVVDPMLVVVGGGLAKPSDLFLTGIRQVLEDRLPFPPLVERTSLDDSAAVLGAATVALDLFSGVPISVGR